MNFNTGTGNSIIVRQTKTTQLTIFTSGKVKKFAM